MVNNSNIYSYMKQAIEIAKTDSNEVPIGAIIVKNGVIIASSNNKKELFKDPTAHAEILVIREACRKLNSDNLSECTMFVTLEPCPMCAGAILLSKIAKVYFGAYDNLYGAMGSTSNVSNVIKSKCQITGGILEDDCRDLIQDFFKKIR